MSTTVIHDAPAALADAIDKRGEQEIRVQCPHCGFPGTWPMYISREVDVDEDGEHFVHSLFQRRRRDGHELTVLDCDTCGEPLTPDAVVPLDEEGETDTDPWTYAEASR